MKNPCCGQPAEVMSSIDLNKPDAVPGEGDVLVCFTCQAWLVFTAAGLRLFDETDFMRLKDEELRDLRRITALLRRFKKEVKV